MGKKTLLSAALVLASQAFAAVTLTPTPSSLTFTYQLGTTAMPPSQTVSVKASSGTPAFTATTDTAWLTVSPDQGTVPASLTVKVNPASLPVGTQPAANVIVTVPGIAPLNIGVLLVITPPAATLGLNPMSLSFTAPPAMPATQTITLTTDGLPISYAATSGAKWMTLSTGGAPSSTVTGVVLSPADAVTLTVSIDATALAPQTTAYVAKITVVASGAAVKVKSQNITVNLTVNASQPTVTSVWPTNLPVNNPAVTITVQGTNFYAKSVAKVVVGGVVTALVTTPDAKSTKILTAILPAGLETTAQTLQVYVSNPAPGGGDSATPNVSAQITIGTAAQIFNGGIVNAASYANGAVSPGELITIFGTNIGPATPAPLTVTAGYVDTSLSGVSVTVDGNPAPIVFVSLNQISVQVPYEANTFGANKVVSVKNGAAPAATKNVTIQAAAPGIFTSDGSGTGQAAALNVTSLGVVTLNSSTNPVKLGDTVVLYLTGEGDYYGAPLSGVALSSNTGYIVPASISPLPASMSPLPTVTIGGADVSAGVTYAGVVPGSMTGVLQIDVAIPIDATTGNTVPVVVTIGGISTQANVTLAIHP